MQRKINYIFYFTLFFSFNIYFSFSLLLLFLPSSLLSCFVRNIFIEKQCKRAAHYAGYSLVEFNIAKLVLNILNYLIDFYLLVVILW